MLLEAGDHTVRVAHDGWAALRAAAEFAPDVVFLDIGMPGMDGYQTARALRAAPLPPGLIIVALTGWGAESDRHKSREAGFNFHLTKPADIGAVDAILAQVPRAA
jgi:CheY-like chemotaxis protein